MYLSKDCSDDGDVVHVKFSQGRAIRLKPGSIGRSEGVGMRGREGRGGVRL